MNSVSSPVAWETNSNLLIMPASQAAKSETESEFE